MNSLWTVNINTISLCLVKQCNGSIKIMKKFRQMAAKYGNLTSSIHLGMLSDDFIRLKPYTKNDSLMVINEHL